MLQRHHIRAITLERRAEIQQFLRSHWGNTNIYSRGHVFRADFLPGFTAHYEQQLVGLLTYRIGATVCDVITLNSSQHEQGIGTALLVAAQQRALAAHCQHLSLVVTNDNLHALRFYMRHGFTLTHIYPHSIDFARRKNPQIPAIGAEGIPLHAELELMLRL